MVCDQCTMDIRRRYKQELPYNDAFHAGPGRFELPAARCTLRSATSAGALGALDDTLHDTPHVGPPVGACAVSAVVLHEHRGARWPMLVYNGSDFDGRWHGRLFPSDNFHQAPTDYLFFVRAKFG